MVAPSDYRKLFRKHLFFTCEDVYQNTRSKVNHSPSDIVAVVEYDSEPPSRLVLQRKLLEVERDLVHDSSPDSHPDPENMFTELVEFQACQGYNTKGFLDLARRKFIYFVNHEWIGGSKLAHSFQIVNRAPQKNLFYRSRWWFVWYAIRLWWNRDRIPRVLQPLPLVEHRRDIRRFTRSKTIDKCPSLKATIVFDVLSQLHHTLHLNRPLVCYLPIAFFPTPTVNNNVGLMWLTFDPTTDTIASLASQMSANQYQILGTNFALYYGLLQSSNGSNARRGVDAVLTIIFSEEQGENVKKSWTFPHIPEYPVYAAISPVIDRLTGKVHVTQTLTVSTPAFDSSRLDADFEARSASYYLIDEDN